MSGDHNMYALTDYLDEVNTVEVMGVFMDFIRDVYAAFGWDIPDEFYPEIEGPRVAAEIARLRGESK